MSGKKKAQKMSLSDFLADDNGTGSWADEMPSLPSAPAGKEDFDGGFSPVRGGDRFGGRDRDFDLPRGPAGDQGGFERRDRFSAPRQDRFAPRAPVELPTEPPFTAHIANLSFEANEDDLADFFGQTKIASIRILRDREERSKGFGYVEFEDLESLKSALELTGESLQGRTIRVNIAEPPKDRPDRAPRQPDRTDVTSWRREAPVEMPERRGGGFRGGGRGGFQDRQRDTSWGGSSGGGFGRRDNRFGRDGPAERPRLNLKPRSTDSPSATSPQASSKASPFGAARPVDTESVLKRIEKKLGSVTVDDETPKSEQES